MQHVIVIYMSCATCGVVGMSHDLFPGKHHIHKLLCTFAAYVVYIGCMSAYLIVVLHSNFMSGMLQRPCVVFVYKPLCSCSRLKPFPLTSWRSKCVTSSRPLDPQSVTSWAECTSPCTSSSVGEAPRTWVLLSVPLSTSVSELGFVAWDKTTLCICCCVLLHIIWIQRIYSRSGTIPPFQLSLFLSHSLCSSLTFALKKRLPSDRVSGTISLSVENDHLEPRPEDIESEAI